MRIVKLLEVIAEVLNSVGIIIHDSEWIVRLIIDLL